MNDLAQTWHGYMIWLFHDTGTVAVIVIAAVAAIGAAFSRATSTREYICDWCKTKRATMVTQDKEHVCKTCVGLPL